MPKVYVIQDDSPNAFATGRNPEHAAVAATTGIMRLLTDEELAGVMAHELGHVKNRDILISTLAATFAGAITYLAHMAQWGAMVGGGRGDDDEAGGGMFGMLFMAILAPHCRHAGPDGYFALAGIQRRRRGSTHQRQPALSCQGTAKTGVGKSADPDGSECRHRTYVYCLPTDRRRNDVALLHPPPYSGACPSPGRHIEES